MSSEFSLSAVIGQPFTITVNDGASAGYLWGLDAASAPQILLEDLGLVDIRDENLKDVGLTEVKVDVCFGRTLTFRCQETGNFILQLRHARPWLPAGQDKTEEVARWKVQVAPVTAAK